MRHTVIFEHCVDICILKVIPLRSVELCAKTSKVTVGRFDFCCSGSVSQSCCEFHQSYYREYVFSSVMHAHDDGCRTQRPLPSIVHSPLWSSYAHTQPNCWPLLGRAYRECWVWCATRANDDLERTKTTSMRRLDFADVCLIRQFVGKSNTTIANDCANTSNGDWSDRRCI